MGVTERDQVAEGVLHVLIAHQPRRRRPLLRRFVGVAALLTAACSLVACTVPPSGASTPDSSGPTEPTSVYVSIGDSYAAGFQPAPFGSADGFAQQIAQRSLSGAEPLTLYNFGCPGATTSAVIEDLGCATAGSTDEAPDYSTTTQLDAVVQTLRANAGRIGLVTISLGGNDIRECLESADPVACSTTAAPTMRQHLRQVLAQVRQAAGQDVPIVGLTYPDVYVSDIESGDPVARARAEASIRVFHDILNPLLAEEYARIGAGFVDITTDSGAYLPATDTVVGADGTITPRAADTVCRYTHYCASGDVHPNTAGYTFIADQVLKLVNSGG